MSQVRPDGHVRDAERLGDLADPVTRVDPRHDLPLLWRQGGQTVPHDADLALVVPVFGGRALNPTACPAPGRVQVTALSPRECGNLILDGLVEVGAWILHRGCAGEHPREHCLRRILGIGPVRS